MNTPLKPIFLRKTSAYVIFKAIKPSKHHLFFYVLVQEPNPSRWLFMTGNPIRIEYSLPATPP